MALIPGQKGWHREQIKAAIRMRGLTLEQLAFQHGYQGSAVQDALRRPWPRVERIIGQFLGIEPAVLWPGRYEGSLHVSEYRRAVGARHRKSESFARTERA
jgi:Ner family transcriptional regulator